MENKINHSAEGSLFRNPFAGMSREQLLREKAIYEKIIAENTPNYIAPVYRITGKRIQPSKCPWMIPIWQKGLAMVEALLKE